MRRFRCHRAGSAVVEFAFVAPILLVLAVGSLQLFLGLAAWDGLQSTAKTAARCLAVGSRLCAAVPSGCASSDAGVCYVLTTANGLGIWDLAASDVTIDTAAIVGDVEFTVVTVSRSFKVFGFGVPLSATASFPNY